MSLGSSRLLGMAVEMTGAWFPTDAMQRFGEPDPRFSQLLETSSDLGS